MLHMGVDEWERSQSQAKWSCMFCKKDKDGKPIFAKDWVVCLTQFEFLGAQCLILAYYLSTSADEC